MLEGEWHAFYSKKQMIISGKLHYNNKNINKSGPVTITNFYRLKGSNQLVEVTQVCSVKENPTLESCNYLFGDGEYLGIVDAWVRAGKRI